MKLTYAIWDTLTGGIDAGSDARLRRQMELLALPDGRRTAGMPALGPGKALAGLGARREPLGARIVRAGSLGGRLTVESAARIWLAGLPVATATEMVTPDFCQLAGTRIASAMGARIGLAPNCTAIIPS